MIYVGATLITLAIVSLGIAIAWIAYIFLWLGLHEHHGWSHEERQRQLTSDPVSSAFRFLFGLILHIWLFPVWLIGTIREWHEMRMMLNSVKAQVWRVQKGKDGYIALMSQEEFERRYGKRRMSNKGDLALRILLAAKDTSHLQITPEMERGIKAMGYGLVPCEGGCKTMIPASKDKPYCPDCWEKIKITHNNKKSKAIGKKRKI